ncbi:MAG: serine/threonine protein kinase [Fuerstiella sp.]|nr:serine/threonine protein kinase [Fuerstiella sp.]MCP4786742.1 serine/threonine protein kinase [Fuerstiella sp.]MCP4857501.1 serine/threonine protein kinase [Fuerstiella sp.]
MPNDRSTSELISKSLSGQLNREQQTAVDDELETNQQSRHFARISKMIHDSLSDVAQRSVAGDEEIAPGLSQESKLRMKQSLRSEQSRLSHSALGATVTADATTQSTDAGSWGPSTAPGDSPQQRRMASRFTLLKKIGEGGLGSVWLARDEMAKRTVALKEMNPDAAEFPRAWERFHREAEITAHLEHPNIVPLYQFGSDTQSSQPFYAMRFVGKRTLVDAIEDYHDRRKAGEDVAMDLHRLLTAFIGVCQAIAYAHSRGVIHRDLKPENVALDNFGQVVVLDWGLAKISDEYESESLLSGNSVTSDSAIGKTLAGEVIGTPLYMAPEQAAGNLEDVDRRTDVYGLGAILFAMLTGSALHQKTSVEEEHSIPIAELLQKIATEPSPQPRDVASGIPADLEAICVTATQFKAHSRYQTAIEVSDAVQRWMAGRSERRQDYANSRSEGRELRTSVMSSVRDLERNVRFMSSLPPIQGIVDVLSGREGDELTTWRERLGVIFRGLLSTNSDFCSVSFARAQDDEFKELIRIERQATDVSNVRSIPASRLSSGPLTDCMKLALDSNPDEVHVALSSECPDERNADTRQPNRLAAGVPVFDAVTEELFGFVRIEADLDRLIESQLRDRFQATSRLFVLDNDCRILLQVKRDGGRVRENDGKPISSITPCWSEILDPLKTRGEFIDEQDHAVYATRIDLVPGRYSLALALCLGCE